MKALLRDTAVRGRASRKSTAASLSCFANRNATGGEESEKGGASSGDVEDGRKPRSPCWSSSVGLCASGRRSGAGTLADTARGEGGAVVVVVVAGRGGGAEGEGEDPIEEDVKEMNNERNIPDEGEEMAAVEVELVVVGGPGEWVDLGVRVDGGRAPAAPLPPFFSAMPVVSFFLMLECDAVLSNVVDEGTETGIANGNDNGCGFFLFPSSAESVSSSVPEEKVPPEELVMNAGGCKVEPPSDPGSWAKLGTCGTVSVWDPP